MAKIAEKVRSKSEQTKAKLLAAARVVIGTKGYTGATVDAIAETAGVSKGVVYYYFKTKADIATNVLIDSIEGIIAQFEHDIAQATNAHEALELLVSDFAHLIFANKETSRFMLTELWRGDRLWSDEMRVVEERLMTVIEGAIQGGIDSGMVRPQSDLRFTATAVVGTVLTSAQYYILLDDSKEEEAFVKHCVEYVQHALQA